MVVDEKKGVFSSFSQIQSVAIASERATSPPVATAARTSSMHIARSDGT